jgi:hypothetical protein
MPVSANTSPRGKLRTVSVLGQSDVTAAEVAAAAGVRSLQACAGGLPTAAAAQSAEAADWCIISRVVLTRRTESVARRTVYPYVYVCVCVYAIVFETKGSKTEDGNHDEYNGRCDAVVFGNLARRAEESIGRRLDKDRARTGLRGGEVRAA